jgi:hypothetical protein
LVYKVEHIFVCTESENRRRSQGVAAVVIRRFSLNEAHLGYLNLFPIICLILKKINIFFNIIAKKV